LDAFSLPMDGQEELPGGLLPSILSVNRWDEYSFLGRALVMHYLAVAAIFPDFRLDAISQFKPELRASATSLQAQRQ